jgi:hypothetical protein
MKTIGPMRKTKFRRCDRVAWQFTFTAAVYTWFESEISKRWSPSESDRVTASLAFGVYAPEDIGPNEVDVNCPLRGPVQNPVQVQHRARMERLALLPRLELQSRVETTDMRLAKVCNRILFGRRSVNRPKLPVRWSVVRDSGPASRSVVGRQV